MRNVKTWYVPDDKERLIYTESSDVADLVLDSFMKWAEGRSKLDRYVGPAVLAGRFTGTESDAGLNGTWTWRDRSYTVVDSVLISPPDDDLREGSKRTEA